MLNLVRADKLGYALGCGVNLCVWALSSEAKLIRVRKEAYLKSHPRNTLVTAHRQSTFAAEQAATR